MTYVKEALLCLAVLAVPASASMDWARYKDTVIQSTIEAWPQAPRAIARKLIAKYGAPNRVSDDRAEWDERGPWRRLVVHREEDFAKRSGVLEQTVRFEVPAGKGADINALGFGVSCDPARGELTAGSDSEEAGILALNVAADVAGGRRGVENARDFYRKTLDLALSGKSSRYINGLLFSPAAARRTRRGLSEMLPKWGVR